MYECSELTLTALSSALGKVCIQSNQMKILRDGWTNVNPVGRKIGFVHMKASGKGCVVSANFRLRKKRVHFPLVICVTYSEGHSRRGGVPHNPISPELENHLWFQAQAGAVSLQCWSSQESVCCRYLAVAHLHVPVALSLSLGFCHSLCCIL